MKHAIAISGLFFALIFGILYTVSILTDHTEYIELTLNEDDELLIEIGE